MGKDEARKSISREQRSDIVKDQILSYLRITT